MLRPADRTTKPHRPRNDEHGRARAAALMECVIRSRHLKHEAAARLVVKVMGKTALFAGLKDLEEDLHTHIHLENAVLFPAAQALAQRN